MDTKSQIIFAADGRQICINEAGDLNGIPVLSLHGTPGSRLVYDPWIEDAHSRGIRLISYDRPGYGRSSPLPGRSVADAASDIATIAKELGLKQLLVWGHSGGGPHALACAALLPDLVIASAVLSSPMPYQAGREDWFIGMGEDNIAEFNAALEGRDSLQKFVDAETPGILDTDPAALLKTLPTLLSPADVAVLTEDLAIFLHQDFSEAIKESRAGWVDDDLAFMNPWGFDLNQVRIPILLIHGEQDQFVHISHAKWLSRNIPGVDARLSSQDGHLTLITQRIPEVHAWLLERI